METFFELVFQQGQKAIAAYLDSITSLPTALEQLGLTTSRPTLVLIGGASGLTDQDADQLKTLFQEVICPLAEAAGWSVIDGGTDAGVMRLIGQAYQKLQCTFSLLGVVVQDKAITPGATHTVDEDAAELEPHHTHFLLVPGQQWGDESAWIAQVAALLSPENASATIVINGGEITLKQDIPNSLKHQRPVLVLAGTGRTADRVAAVATGQTSDAEIQSLIDSGLIVAIDWLQNQDMLYQKLQTILNPSSKGLSR
ncbi:hypothetical protein [Pantanalinema sp. GBBB05]|uniref:hypothetical protein n=1 Tax=Pantanalinema sp. GBBB05 TaxID=2604139 RepID=UPI003D819537